jgi:hypothetical protein
MQRKLSTVCIAALFLGAGIAVLVTWTGDALGMALEGLFPVNLRSWELAALQVMAVNAPAGALVALLGVLSGRWSRGLGVGAAIHALVFVGLITTSDSFRAAPPSVDGWILAVGVIGGGLAGAVGGALAQVALSRKQPSGGLPIS